MIRVFRFGIASVLLMIVLWQLPVTSSADALHISPKAYAGGVGTKEEPYLISSYEHLVNLQNHSGACFLLTNDVQIPEEAYSATGVFSDGWIPVDFTGEFNGNGHCIENLRIKGKDTAIGMFAVNCGLIRDLTVCASQVSVCGGNVSAGFIAGENEGTILRCKSERNVLEICDSGEFVIGGLVGRNFGTMKGVTNRSAFSLDQIGRTKLVLGGLVGINTGWISEGCNLESIDVTGGEELPELAVGGVVGIHGGGTVCYAYNKGSVFARTMGSNVESYIGGFAGVVQSGTVNDCFNAGRVQGSAMTGASDSVVGDFVGCILSAGIENAYAISYEEPTFYGLQHAGEASALKGCYCLVEGNADNNYVGTGFVILPRDAWLRKSDYSFDFDEIWSAEKHTLYPGPYLKALQMEYTPADYCDAFGHDLGQFIENNDATENSCATMTAYCNLCGVGITEEIPDSMLKKQGWHYIDGQLRYYVNGVPKRNSWLWDGTGWLYFGPDAYILKNAWQKDSFGWCYVGADGYMVRNCWQKDSYDWCYIGADGYMVANTWRYDFGGWVYLGRDGHIARNRWILRDGKWYYLDNNGFFAVLQWRRDSYGWVFLGADGAMKTNAWCMDSNGWCYVGADGYAITDCWKRDSYGWLHFDSEGSMFKNRWLFENGVWYYFDNSGYMLWQTASWIGGKLYRFAENGVCLNP